MKRKTAFAVVGFALFGLGIASFIAHVLWQIKSGHGGDTYYNFKHQPMTYWGALGTMAIMALVGLVGLFYRAKRAFEDRRARKLSGQQD
jgi:hypothetical protein